MNQTVTNKIDSEDGPERPGSMAAPSGAGAGGGGVFECDGCGACCKTWRIFASEEDAAREPRIAAEARRLPENQKTEHWAFQLFPLPFHEACCFLDGENRCTIYDTRPRVCRAFEAGSDRCQEARRELGLEALPPAVTRLTIEGKSA